MKSLSRPIHIGMAIALTGISLTSARSWTSDPAPIGPQQAPPAPRFTCLPVSPAQYVTGLRAAIQRGDIPHPATRPAPRRLASVAPATQAALGSAGCGGSASVVVPYEDTNLVLDTHFPDLNFVTALLAEAASAVITSYGDEFDTIGFWVNFPLTINGMSGSGGLSTRIST